jgi:pyruvate/2-oxoglutarate dehydrogenase complex dihydrolipoamide acyltransferase (E2) component
VRCQLKMPKVGDAADTAVVISLSAAVGDQVAAGQELLVVETDKSNVEVPSPFSGTVSEILVRAGQEVSTGEPIFVLEV